MSITLGSRSGSGAKVLERWLRGQARCDLDATVHRLASRLDVTPERIYVMDQRTKWGNCSRLRNLSFNWRLVMAPPTVLQYLVTHEMVHLIIPDHSHKFWLTVQSLHADAERSRQWLAANNQVLRVDLSELTNIPAELLAPAMRTGE